MQPTRRALPFFGARLETGRIVLNSIGMGLLVGVFGTLLAWVLEALQDAFLSTATGLRPPGLPAEGGVLQAYAAERAWLLPVVLVLGGAGVAIWRSRRRNTENNAEKDAKKSDETLDPDGVNAALMAYHQGNARANTGRSALELLQGTLSAGVGVPLGRESAFSSLAMLLSNLFARLTRLSEEDRRLMFVAALAGMLGLALRAPLAGAVLAVEMLYRRFEFEIEALMPAVLSSVIAFAVYGLFRGFDPLFQLETLAGQPSVLLPAFFVLGLLEAGAAAGFVAALRGLREAWGLVRIPVWARVSLGAALIGLLGVFTPYALGDGLGWLQLSLSSFLPISAVLALLVLRVGAALLAGSSGIPGGLITPSLVVGGLLGNLYAQGLNALIPSYPIEPAAFTLAGMAAFLAGAVNAPLAATLLITEWSGYGLLVPLLMTTLAGYALTGRESVLPAQAESRSSSPVHINEYLRRATGLRDTPDLLDLLERDALMVSDDDDERLYRFPVPEAWRNQIVRELDWQGTLLVAILREGHIRVPRGNTELEPNDELIVMASKQAHAHLTGQPLEEDTPSDKSTSAAPTWSTRALQTVSSAISSWVISRRGARWARPKPPKGDSSDEA
jgi:chloride channel protein, CIC family